MATPGPVRNTEQPRRWAEMRGGHLGPRALARGLAHSPRARGYSEQGWGGCSQAPQTPDRKGRRVRLEGGSIAMAYTPRVPSESPPTPLFIHLSTHQFSPAAVLPHNHISIPLSTHPSTHLSIHLSIHPCIHPPIRPSTHLSDNPLFCLFTHSFSFHPLAHLSLRPSSPTPSPRATPHLGSGLSCQSPEMT